MADQFPVVRTYNDSGTLPVDFLEYCHDFSRKLRVEVPCRFICQEYLGIIHYRPGDGHSLLLAVRKLRRILPHFVVKVDQSQRIEGAPADLFTGDPKNLKDDRDILEDFFLEEQAKILEDNPHASSYSVYSMVGDAEDIPVVDDNLSLSRKDLSENEFEESCFA